LSDDGELLTGLLQPLLLGDDCADADGDAGAEPFSGSSVIASVAVAAASMSPSQLTISWQSSSRLWLSLLVLLLLSPLLLVVLLLVPLLVPAAAAAEGEADVGDEVVAVGTVDEDDDEEAEDDEDEDVELTGRPGASTSACTRSPLCAALTSITSFRLAASHA
jgi:hypothetical protein